MQFTKLLQAIANNEEKITYIANGGMKKGRFYRKTISAFMKDIEIGFDEDSKYTSKEITFILNELAVSKTLFDLLIEYEEVESFFSMTMQYKKLSVYKKIFQIYFVFYNVLYQEEILTFFTNYLKNILKGYDGKSRYIKKLVSLKDYIFGDFEGLLEYFNDDFEVVKKELNLQEGFEFFKVLLNLKIVRDLKQLEYDEQNNQLFREIEARKDIYFQKGSTLKEYVVIYLLDRAIKEQKPFLNWQDFIIKLMGDPRSLSEYNSQMGSWNSIGKERKEFFIQTLSRDDLKVFLETLSDSVSDTNYHYRKAFWMQFLDKVLFAKLMIGTNAYIGLNNQLKQKFQLNKNSYSFFKGNQTQSAIYIDLGAIKVIEFTHNGKVRFYHRCPLDLQQKEYRRDDFVKFNNSLIDEIVHSSPTAYNWQQKVLNLMQRYMYIDVKIEDVYIEEDKEKLLKYRRSRDV